METLLQKAQRLNIQPMKKPQQGTAGVFDAVKKGFSNIKESIQNSGQELSNTLDSNVNPFIKTAKTATTLIKGVINPIAEAAIATPARVAGEVAQNVTGIDVNEAVSKGVQSLVQKGLDTEMAKKAMDGWAKLKETDPESAMALSAALDIGNISSNAVGMKGASVVGEAATKVAGKAAELAGSAASSTAGKVGDLGGFAVRQSTGLSRDTISQIVQNPEFFTKAEMAKIDKEAIVNKVASHVQNRLDALSETGKEYNIIRKSGDQVTIPEGTLENVLHKYGIGISPEGKIITTAESVPLSSGDISALEGFISQYGAPTLSGNGFLNARKALSNMSKFDSTKTDISNTIAKDIRATYDAIGKRELTGLAELDAKYAPEIKLLGSLKKQLFEPDGTLKQGAIQKIANLTGPGKEKLLEKLKQIVPGVETDVNILKSLKDIEAVNNQKVGAYASAALKSGVAGAVVSGGNPLVAIGAAIMSSPQVAIPLIRGYAVAKGMAKEAIGSLVDKIKAGGTLLNNEKKLIDDALTDAARKAGDRLKNFKGKAGLSVEDVSGGKAGYSDPLLQEAKKYNTPEEFISHYRGSATQYNDYTPELRLQGLGGHENITKLGIDPEEMVTIYRGIDDISGKVKRKINEGDFVTTDFDSALSYTGSPKDVVSMQVKAKDLYVSEPKDFADDPFYTGAEYIYTKQGGKVKTESELTDLWKKATGVVPKTKFDPQLEAGKKMMAEGPSAQFEKALARKEQNFNIGVLKARNFKTLEDFRKAFPKVKEDLLKKVFIESRK